MDNNENLNNDDYIIVEEISEVLDKDGNTIEYFSNKNKNNNHKDNNYKSFLFTINNNSLFGKILPFLILIIIILLIYFLTFYVVPAILVIYLIAFLIRKIFKRK